MPRLTILNGYEATCSAGIVMWDDEIPVDAVPPGGAVTRDTIAVPMIAVEPGGAMVDLAVTGWTDAPSPALYIDAHPYGDIAGPFTVRCAPTAGVHACAQPSESLRAIIDGGTYNAECGLTHYLEVRGASEVSIESTRSAAGHPFGVYTSAIETNGHRSTFILYDYYNTQPTLTWSHDATSILWENGDPQFTSGKRNLLVEIAGGGDTLFGWFRLFA